MVDYQDIIDLVELETRELLSIGYCRLMRVGAALMMVAMAGYQLVIILGLSRGFLAVRATISVSRGAWTGASLMGTYLWLLGTRTCHTIKPLINKST